MAHLGRNANVQAEGVSAGWTVTLAGAEGKELERRFNTELAALMIYDASCPDFKINPARFYDDNDAALADMKKLASHAK